MLARDGLGFNKNRGQRYLGYATVMLRLYNYCATVASTLPTPTSMLMEKAQRATDVG